MTNQSRREWMGVQSSNQREYIGNGGGLRLICSQPGLFLRWPQVWHNLLYVCVYCTDRQTVSRTDRQKYNHFNRFLYILPNIEGFVEQLRAFIRWHHWLPHFYNVRSLVTPPCHLWCSLQEINDCRYFMTFFLSKITLSPTVHYSSTKYRPIFDFESVQRKWG